MLPDAIISLIIAVNKAKRTLVIRIFWLKKEKASYGLAYEYA